MKKHVLTLVLWSGTLLIPTVGNSQIFPISAVLKTQSDDEIDLRGRIEPGEIRKNVNAISAFLQENNIRAQFHFDMGIVLIVITDGTGTPVYTTTTVSSIGETLIPTTAFISGNYTITFTASSGEMSGNFVL